MENKKRNSFGLSVLNKLTAKIIFILVLIVVLFIMITCAVKWVKTGTSLQIGENKNIDLTPALIKNIEEIGEWEFLQISDEELVDTISRGFFTDSELVRIYYGVARLGIDLHQAEPQWLRVEGDSIIATLPPIVLLDRNFIDEARTRSFFEKGKWTDDDREQLYKRAYRKMLKRCMTTNNIKIAEDNARQQFTQFLRSMGYKKIRVDISTKRK